MHNIKISSVKCMTASPDQQIQISGIVDLEHLVNSIDDSAFNFLFALVQNRIASKALESAKKEIAIGNLQTLKGKLK